MPRANPERRGRLADAAIEVLARDGARGLTHRAVDAAAGVPAGTTSRYFRTREALLHGVVEHSVGSLTAALARAGEGVREPGVEAMAGAVAIVVTEAVTGRRDRSAAICELLLEARRRPDLAGQLNQAREALLDLLRRIAKATQVDVTDEQAVQLLAFATGTVLTTLTGPAPENPDELLGRRVEPLVRGAVAAILRSG
ncbi:TetR/AcrR family transcriptional regulator [Flindersiella endophytica]